MSTKIKVAILAGGDTEERVVSVKSAGVVHKYLHGEKYDARIIDINGREWIDLDTGHSIDKNDFPWIWAGRNGSLKLSFVPSMVRPWRMALSRVISTSLEYLILVVMVLFRDLP